MPEKSGVLNVILLFLVLFVLKSCQAIFLPFFVALFLWVLIYILSSNYSKFFVERLRCPQCFDKISRVFAIMTIAGVVYFIVVGIKSNINDVVEVFNSSGYSQGFNDMMAKLQKFFHIETKITFSTLVSDIDIPKAINSLVQGFASLLSMSFMVVVYLLFILLEEKSISKKFPLLFSTEKKEKDARKMLEKIYSKIEVYMSVKLFTSFLTGVLGYAIMRWVNLDFAVFWAILMFLFNFIPTVGSVVASVFPIVYAMLQFNGNIASFLVVSIGILLVQVIIGNIVDPRVMGRRLNLSPLVLILSLVIWGSIWGVVGMFLSVPIMIILTIVLLQLPSTKRYAILLTKDGETF